MVTMLLSACLSPSSLLAEETKNTMALPDWAYGQRQRLSPILIQGEVTEVNCLGTQCTLTMTILEVLRNQSQETLEPGEAIVITLWAMDCQKRIVLTLFLLPSDRQIWPWLFPVKEIKNTPGYDQQMGIAMN